MPHCLKQYESTWTIKPIKLKAFQLQTNSLENTFIIYFKALFRRVIILSLCIPAHLALSANPTTY